MQSLRKKFRQTLKRKKKSSEGYYYHLLQGKKNGYVVEYRDQNYTQLFHYKYKENNDGTLTKYGYLLNGYDATENDENRGCKNCDKDYVFFQTVADKEQIELEKRWMEELRAQQEIFLPSDEDHEWVDIMQHNNRVPICDGIQKRRLHEVLSRRVDENQEAGTTTTTEESERPPPGHANNHLPMIDTVTRTKSTPPAAPYSYSQNSLLNIHIPQRNKNQQEKPLLQEKSVVNSNNGSNVSIGKKNWHKKHDNLVHPKFTQTDPIIHEYDPEESLVYKECQCEHCIVGDYNE